MFSERLGRLNPYVPGEQPRDRRYIKLNTNENPYPPCPAVRELLAGFDAERLRLYPDPLAYTLRAKIADLLGVNVENVFVGNGSDEVLSFCFFAFFDSKNGPLLFPEHTYSFYPVYCDFYSILSARVPLASDFTIDIDAYVNGRPSCGIIIPNPNAPTGIYLDVAEIERLLHGYPEDRVVVIDEAYIDFGGTSTVTLLDRHRNLLVVRTFSKSFSLAGVRLGFAVGHPDLVTALFTVKDSFNSYPLDTVSQAIGAAAVSDPEYYAAINAEVARTRDETVRRLAGTGWHVLPSLANFIFARKIGVPGRVVYERLREHGILVRYFDRDGIRDYVRITIGTDAEMNAFLDAASRLF
jgi:histidinol-phosphate aminotransferase